MMTQKDMDMAVNVQQTQDVSNIFNGLHDFNDGEITVDHEHTGYWIVKLNAKGDIDWWKSLGGARFGRITSIQQTIDGGYFIAGESKNLGKC